MSLKKVFWVVAGGDVVLAATLLLNIVVHPTSRYDGLIAVILLGFAVLVSVLTGSITIIGRPTAYLVGLGLAVLPPAYLGAKFVEEFATSGGQALAARLGYFTAPADRALADAIIAGDAAKVTATLPLANPNAVGLDSMGFMRLALSDGRANPEIVAALLKAGANPDQDHQFLFGTVNDQGVVGEMITERNEPLLRAVLGTGIDLNHDDSEGRPRFFAGVRWPEGLALMLDHGANPEAEDRDGNTALMTAVELSRWGAIDVLLAHGARVDHVNHQGVSLRDLVTEMAGRYRRNGGGYVPPELERLEARLR